MANAMGKDIASSKWTPAGGSEATLCITGWTWSESADLEETTDSCTAGIEDYDANIFRGSGNLTGNYKINAPIHDDAGVVAGEKGVLKNYVSATQFFQIPCIVEKVNYAGPVRGHIENNFDYKLCHSAGTYAYPIIA